MFSKSIKYILKSVLFLAINSSADKKIMVKTIAKHINGPEAYIAKLLQELAKKNLISSIRGPNGGFYLSEDNRKASLFTIIQAIGGEAKLTNCLLSIEKCNETKPCPLHNLSNPFRQKLIKDLKDKKIIDFANDIKEGKAFLPI